MSQDQKWQLFVTVLNNILIPFVLAPLLFFFLKKQPEDRRKYILDFADKVFDTVESIGGITGIKGTQKAAEAMRLLQEQVGTLNDEEKRAVEARLYSRSIDEKRAHQINTATSDGSVSLKE